MKVLDTSSEMTVSEYLVNLSEQLLSDDTPLNQFQLPDGNEVSVLKGNPTEHQHVHAVHDLLRECQGEESDLLCRYLLQMQILRPTRDLYASTASLKYYQQTPKLKLMNQRLETSLGFSQANLVFSPSIKNGWDALPQRQRDDIKTNLMLAGLGGGLLRANFVYGQKTSSPGAGRLKHRVLERYASIEKLGIKLKPYPVKSPSARVAIKNKYRTDSKVKTGKKLYLSIQKQQSFERKNLSAAKGGGLVAILTISTLAILNGIGNVEYYEQDMCLGSWERVSLFIRGVFSFAGANPHPESVQQYTDGSTANDKIMQHVTDFLITSPNLTNYVTGLGQLSKINENELILMPSHCSGNLNEPKPDLGWETYLPSINSFQGITRKKVHKASRKTPLLVSQDTEYIGVPAYDPETEPTGSAFDADKIPYILKNMLGVQNKTRAANLEKKYLSYYDLILCNEGTIVGSEAEENIFDASQISAETIDFSDGSLKIKTETGTGTGTTTLNIQHSNVFIGRSRANDTVNCLHSFYSVDGDRPYVVMQEGAGSELASNQKVRNCPNGLISRHTDVYSLLSEPHQYDINQGEGKIKITLATAKDLSLRFNLTLDELLQRVVMQSERLAGLTKLELNIDRMKIIIVLQSDATLTLVDKKGTRIYFEVIDPDSWMILKQIGKDDSTKEKIKVCRDYQQRVSDKKISCLLLQTIAETEKEAIKNVVFIDPVSREWFLIENGENRRIDFIPRYSEGSNRLTLSDIEKNPYLAISFPIENITYARDGASLVLGRKSYSLSDFSLYFVGYFQNSTAWEPLHLINPNPETSFDCEIGSYCISGKKIEKDSLNAISLDDQIKEKEQKLFEYYSFSKDTSTRKKIYPNQRLSESGEWQTVSENEKRLVYIKLEGFIPTNITVHKQGSDLIFGIKTDNNRFEISVNNWASSLSHKIEEVIFNGFPSASLSRLGNENAEIIEKKLRKILFQAQVQNKLKGRLSSSQLAQLKALLLNGFITTSKSSVVSKIEAIQKAFGFLSSEDLLTFYAISKIQPISESTLKLADSDLVSATEALYWLAASTCLVTHTSLVQRLFPMYGADEIANLCDVTNKDKQLQSVNEFILNVINHERFNSVKDWIVAGIKARDQTVEEADYSHQPALEYNSEEMLGDQPANGFIGKENYAAPSMEPRLIGSDSSTAPSITDMITKEANVNTSLLFGDMIARKLTGNPHSAPRQNISLERKREPTLRKTMTDFESAIKKGKEWEQSESETASGNGSNGWTIPAVIGGLAGILSMGGIAGYLYRSKRQQENQSGNDLEKGITRPLNFNPANNVGNDEYSLNTLDLNECATLFGDDEEGDGSEGSSSLSPPIGGLFRQGRDWYVGTKSQKKSMKTKLSSKLTSELST